MAYQQSQAPVGTWSRIMLAYKRHQGSWAWMLHRVSGVALTVYLFVHILALRGLTQGAQAFNDEMALFTQPVFKFAEWALFAFVIFHSMNGIRIATVDLGNGSRYHKATLKLVYFIGITLMVFMAVLIFLDPFGQQH
ncbi:MAG TPA: succinate dehydrogenase, cytochrome b556 subunit [Flavobacteriales bacterium]|nr:succinate dehydrogenase, cytochrome b556 subunit [Flavobacteriales bacterium]